jgi:hypothetical protein
MAPNSRAIDNTIRKQQIAATRAPEPCSWRRGEPEPSAAKAGLVLDRTMPADFQMRFESVGFAHDLPSAAGNQKPGAGFRPGANLQFQFHE